MKRALFALLAVLGLAALGYGVWVASKPRSAAPPAVSTAGPSPTVAEGASGITVIRGGTLIDGTGGPPLANAFIRIDNGRIAKVASGGEVPPEATVIDASGKYVIPGLSDMHNHLRSGTSSAWQEPSGNLKFLFAWGITDVFVPALTTEFLDELHRLSADPAAPYPHFFSTGPIFTANAPPSTEGGDYAPHNAEEARADVRELKAAGVDGVKLFQDDMSWLLEPPLPVFPPDVVSAIVDEAHKQGLKVYVHAPILRFARQTLEAGADVLLHGIISEPIDDDFIALLKKNHAWYVATMSLFEDAADPEAWVRREQAFDSRKVIPKSGYAELLAPQSLQEWQEHWNHSQYTRERLSLSRQNLKKVFDAGVPVAVGTDTGIRGVIIGVSSLLELTLHVEAGLTPMQVIQLATRNGARMVGHEKDWGTIEPGKLADMLILDADPLADIANVRSLSRIVKGGEVYDPEQLWVSMGGMNR